MVSWLASPTAMAAKPESKEPAALLQKSEVMQACERLSDRLKPVAPIDCRKSGLTTNGGRSRNGFPILVRRFAPQKTQDAGRLNAVPVNAASANTGPAGAAPAITKPAITKPAGAAPARILLIGGIHGDELTATAIVFQWMQMMNMGVAPQFDWKVAPLVNPDGLFANKPTRVNAGGVDLNRNFPTPNWAVDAPRYWVKETGSDPRRFPGKAPLSEPESRWVNDEIHRFKPNVIISVHAPFGVLDFDGPAPAPKRFGRLLLNPVGIYPGSLGNYSGKFKNIPVITIELPNALAMPTEAETQKIWSDMLDWITSYVASHPA